MTAYLEEESYFEQTLSVGGGKQHDEQHINFFSNFDGRDLDLIANYVGDGRKL